MAQVPLFIDKVQDTLVSNDALTAKGITKKRVYRQYLPQVKDPEYPLITLSYEVQSTDVGLNVDSVKLYVQIQSQQFIDTYEMQTIVQNLLHLFTYADGNIIVYKCFNAGGPTVPFHDKDLNHWESSLEFDVEVGDAT
jgi:hypothetical protein